MSEMRHTENDDGLSQIEGEPDVHERQLLENPADEGQHGSRKPSDRDHEEDIDDLQARIDTIHGSIGETYDPDNEPLPDVPAYRPGFRKVETLCEMLFEQALAIFEQPGYSDEFTKKISQSIHDVRNPQYSVGKKIAFFGDSGVGKSSLINSLLNSPELAPKGSTGSACTCVITEFKNASELQKTPFLAEVGFYENEEITSMLQEHYANYFKFCIEQPEDIDGDDAQVLEANGTTAKDIFKALFADRLDFNNSILITEFLNSGQSVNDKNILRHLSQWVADMINRQCKETRTVSFTADTAEELASTLRPFVEMRNQLEDEELVYASYWPLIRLVRVGLKSPLLARGVIIADLPGLSDTNRARARTTTQYLRSCACAIIVAPIKRIMTDDSLHRKLMTILSRPGKTKLLICTMIDDLDPSTTRARDVAINRAAAEKHEKLSEIYKTRKHQNLVFAKSMKKLRGKERQDAENIEARQLVQENILKTLVLDSLVKLRNARINRAIHGKYEEITPNARTLGIHFVSSRDYELHLEGYPSSRIPLPVSSTGVPKLRYCLSSIPAEDKLMVLEHHYKGNLRTILDTLAIWSSKSTSARSKDLRKVVLKPRKAVDGLVQTHFLKLREVLTKEFLKPLAEYSSEEWREHGLELWNSWNEMLPVSFSAWCRKNGVHQTKKCPYQDWNEQLLKAVKDTLRPLWPQLNELFEDCTKDLSATLLGLLDGVRRDFDTIPGASVLPMTPFLKSLSTRKDHLRNGIAQFSTAVAGIMTEAYDVATSSEDDTALMDAMFPIYDRLVCLKGPQVGQRRKALLKVALDKSEPFSKFQSKLGSCFEKFFQKQEKALTEYLSKIFDEVIYDYDLLTDVEEVPDSRRDSLKDEVQKFLKHAEIHYNGPIAEEFAKAVKL